MLNLAYPIRAMGGLKKATDLQRASPNIGGAIASYQANVEYVAIFNRSSDTVAFGDLVKGAVTNAQQADCYAPWF